MKITHSLLSNQIRESGVEIEKLTPEFEEFLSKVDSSYQDLDSESMHLRYQELNKANLELEAILDAFPDLIIRLGRDCTLVDFKVGSQRNPFPGISSPLGMCFSSIIKSIKKQELSFLVDEVLDKNILRHFEYDYTYGNEPASFEMRLLPADENHVLGVIRNITDKKAAEAINVNLHNQLVLAQRMQAVGRLAGGISHDFNNILFSVMGYTQIAMKQVSEENPAFEHLSEVLLASQRGKELVEQIMIFSRFKEKKEEAVDLREIVLSSQKLIHPRLNEGLDLKLNLPEKIRGFTGDATQISQSIMNIATNAVQAIGKKGGLIEIRLEDIELESILLVEGGNLPPGKYAKVSISDDGPGMPDAVRAKIFEPFFSTKKVGEGTGLGLSVVLGVVQEHGGGLVLKTEVGEGTRFELYYPTAQNVESKQEIKIDKLVSGEGKILVVDDERMLGKLMSKMLGSLGYEVTTFISSLDAFEYFENEPAGFDLILTDFTMPGISGLDLSKKIKQIRPEIPVILCSGYNDDVTDDYIKEAGVRVSLKKPITFEKLSQEIAKALGVIEE